MKALILVGGFGTRLRPLTLSKPKPLVEFCNEPMVMHQIRALRAVGVKEVVLAVNFQSEKMEEGLAKYEKELGIKITFSLEDQPLGTAGPLKLAEKCLRSDGEPFFVLNSDVICDYNFADLLKFHKTHGKEGTILVTKVKDPSRYGVVLYDDNGKIRDFVEKPPVFVGDRINAGMYLFNSGILDRIEPRPTSIEREIFPKMAAEGQLYAMDLPGYWMDIGQPRDFIGGMALHLKSLQEKGGAALYKGEGVKGNVLAHPTVKVGADCTLGPNVSLGAGVVIGDGACLENTIVLPGGRIGAHTYVDTSIVGWDSKIGDWCRVEGVSVLGEDVKVKDKLYLNGARVLFHKDIKASVRQPEIIM